MIPTHNNKKLEGSGVTTGTASQVIGPPPKASEPLRLPMYMEPVIMSSKPKKY